MASLSIEIGYVHFNGTDRLLEFGLPIKKGLVFHNNGRFYFTLEDKTVLQSEATVISTWPCESVKWMHVKIVCQYSGTLRLLSKENIESDIEPILKFVEREWKPIDDVSQNLFKIQSNQNSSDTPNQTNPIITLLPETLELSPILKLKSATNLTTLSILSAEVQNSEIQSKLRVTFDCKHSNDSLEILVEIGYCTSNREISISVKIHNTNAAEHRNNTWDLGDENSMYIEDFSFLFKHKNTCTPILFVEEQGTKNEEINGIYETPFTLTQYGSGGANWQSPVHWDENKNSTVKKQGFELIRLNKPKLNGLRSRPIVGFKDKERNTTIEINEFWQNFPISIEGNRDTVRFQMFCSNTELQGGESKTWRFRIASFSANEVIEDSFRKTIESSTLCSYLPSYLDETRVLPHLNLSGTNNCLCEIIEQGIAGSQNFFKKRECIDEYGWRNYGDIYADHEVTKGFQGEFFVSHYNNQYDPLYGMTLQYLISSNQLWLQLIKPLSLHTQDIDIYDTELDKGEYNGGLMWHTDHYLPAETCTHRSNSRHHIYAYDGFLGGGGPGGQHCYTTGLLLQYLLFSDERAKEKVLQLTNWVRRFYNGSGSLLERTFRFLTIDLKNNQLTMIGRTFAGYRYPLDRGTGNFLVALMDSFEINNDPALLKEIGLVIRNTVHPSDDLKARDLNNVEDSWFYTVFFQAVVRFLFLKEMLDQIDADYHYSRQSFLHYVDWMLSNEEFYLNRPEILEFPNDTWCAQDIRKANLFYYGYYFSPTVNDKYIKRGDNFYEYVTDHLAASKEQQYTRILSILMQNEGTYQMFNSLKNGIRDLPRSPVMFIEAEKSDPPTFKKISVIGRYCKDMLVILTKFSLTNEWDWLKFRINKIIS